MITYQLFHIRERERVVDIINQVAGEGKFLQTEGYVATTDWENILRKGVDLQRGRLLVVVKEDDLIVGFGRLFPISKYRRTIGNIGLVLLPNFRYKGVGKKLLKLIVDASTIYGYELLTADILADNFISLRLFQSCGFTEYSRRSLNLQQRVEAVEEVRVRLLLPKGVRETNVQLSNYFEAD